MRDSLDVTVVGDVEVFGKTLRKFLKKSCYYLFYKPETHVAELFANHNAGGESLIILRNIDYEVARKLAENLGLSADRVSDERPLSWGKWNPTLTLFHDGSSEAEMIRVEMLRLGIPHIVYKNSSELSLVNALGRYKRSSWSVEQMMKLVQEETERYKEQLATTP